MLDALELELKKKKGNKTKQTKNCGKLPCGCWELSLGPPEGQPVLLIIELSPASFCYMVTTHVTKHVKKGLHLFSWGEGCVETGFLCVTNPGCPGTL